MITKKGVKKRDVSLVLREKNLRTKVEGFRVSIEKKRRETVLKPGRDTTLKTKKE